MPDHPTFNIRRDDYSFQMTSPASQRFFLRLTSPPEAETMMFTDFLLEPSDDELALAALQELETSYGRPKAGMTLCFRDIYPSYQSTNDKAELTRRHDQIVKIVRAYLVENGTKIEDVYMDRREDVFDTVIRL